MDGSAVTTFIGHRRPTRARTGSFRIGYAFSRCCAFFGVLLLAIAGSPPRSLRAQGQNTLQYAEPADVGMSPAILESGVQLFRDAVERGDLAGAVLLVAKDGKVVLHEAVGWRNAQQRLPMERNTMFRMASNTKPVVATAISMLVERRKMEYEAPVRRYIPAFDNYRAGFIQVRHLLSHTSDLRINSLFLEPLMESSPEHPDAPTLQLEVARFGNVGAERLPGEAYRYNNAGFNTLGALVEIASGMSLEAFLRAEIYEPLGMVDSYNREVAEKLDGKLTRMSAIHSRNESGEWTLGWEPGDPPQVPFVRASGGMVSTAWDYAIFCQMFLNGGSYGGVRLLESRTVERMTTRKSPEIVPLPPGSAGRRAYYGYGWFVREDGIYSHYGSDGTLAWVDPEHGIVGVVLTGTPRGANPRELFMDVVAHAVVRDD
jgi:CubicO group peptidase (beta-lactamase class C family)